MHDRLKCGGQERISLTFVPYSRVNEVRLLGAGGSLMYSVDTG